MSADWGAIRNEYVTTQISLRDLAKKTGQSFSTISRRAKKEEWSRLRREHEEDVRTKVAQKVAESSACTQADLVRELMDYGRMSARLLGIRLEQMAQAGKVKPYEIKAITEALKNVRDLYKVDQSAADEKFQKARELLGGIPDALDG